LAVLCGRFRCHDNNANIEVDLRPRIRENAPLTALSLWDDVITMNDIYLGIDLGSTGLKAVAFEAVSGRVLAAGGGTLPYARPVSGACERSATAIQNSLVRAISEVTRGLGANTSHIRGIGCTGHGAGLFALDAKGELMGGVSVGSTDQRGAARARAIAQRHGESLARQVGGSPWAGQPTVLAAELHGDDAIQRGALRHILFAKDYLCWLLTGEMSTDASDASTAGLLSLGSGTWSAEAMAASGLHDLSERNFPPLVAPGSAVGRLREAWAEACGLPPGIPVCTSAIDLLTSMHAVGAARNDSAVAVLGTWSVNAVIAPVVSPQPEVAAVVHFGERANRLYMDNSPSGMANLDWLATTLQWSGTAAVFDAAFTLPFGAGPRFLPFIHGAAPAESAGFIGVQAQHGPTHLARAAVNAVAALHVRHLARLRAAGLNGSKRVIALGGGARDVRMARLLAGLLGHAVQRCDDESGARGAALYAAMSQGHAADALPVRLELVEPNAAEMPAMADYLSDFDALLHAMAPAFRQLAPREAR
jgi:L-xylulokinase